MVSARYSPSTSDDRRVSGASGVSATPEFSVLDLSKPADIIAAFVHVRNIDVWTCGGFQDKVVAGVEELMTEISRGEAQFSPWKMRSILPAATAVVAVASGVQPKVEDDETVGPKTASTLPRRSARKVCKPKVVTRSPPEENTTTKKKKVGKKPQTANSAGAATTSSGRILRARK